MQIPNINTAFTLIKKRILLAKEPHKKELIRFKNIHQGERCFIIATGPSLTINDCERVKDEYTFSVNSCIKLFEKTEWRPDYYVISDPRVYQSIGNELKNCRLKQVFYSDSIPYSEENGVQFLTNRFRKALINSYIANIFFNKEHFLKASDRIEKFVYDGSTVIFIVLQIAIYMGFSKIYLLGTDCNYSGTLQHMKDIQYEIDAVSNAGDYMIEDYKCLKNFAEKKNVEIYNATRGGKLEVFPRIDFDELKL